MISFVDIGWYRGQTHHPLWTLHQCKNIRLLIAPSRTCRVRSDGQTFIFHHYADYETTIRLCRLFAYLSLSLQCSPSAFQCTHSLIHIIYTQTHTHHTRTFVIVMNHCQLMNVSSVYICSYPYLINLVDILKTWWYIHVLLIHICNTHVACIEAHIHTSTLLNALFLSIFLISFAIRSVKKLLAWRNDMQWRRVAGIRELSLSCTIPCCKQLHKRCFHTLTIFSAKRIEQSQRSCTMTTSAFLPDRKN